MSTPFSLDEILAAALVRIDPQVKSKRQSITTQHQMQLCEEVEQSQYNYAQTLLLLGFVYQVRIFFVHVVIVYMTTSDKLGIFLRPLYAVIRLTCIFIFIFVLMSVTGSSVQLDRRRNAYPARDSSGYHS